MLNDTMKSRLSLTDLKILDTCEVNMEKISINYFYNCKENACGSFKV